MNNDHSIDYQAVLADLTSRRDKLNDAIAGIEAMLGTVPSAGGDASHRNDKGPAEIREDSFFGMTILDAAKKFLGMTKRPQSAAQVTDALKQGGYLFQSGNPVNTVGSVLNRSDAKGGDVIRVGRGSFGLASWYPNRPKRKKSNGDSPEADELSEDSGSEVGGEEDLSSPA